MRKVVLHDEGCFDAVADVRLACFAHLRRETAKIKSIILAHNGSQRCSPPLRQSG
jgi:hypothetical protein